MPIKITTTTDKSFSLFSAGFFCLMLWAPVSQAQPEIPHTCAVFCGARDQLQDTFLTPIRQLEGDALFESAAAMRERVMSSEQRILNQFWLNDTADTRLHGGKVWSRLLRYGVKRYNSQRSARRGLSAAELRAERSALEQDDLFEYGTFAQDRGEYQLRLSDDNIRFIIHYSF